MQAARGKPALRLLHLALPHCRSFLLTLVIVLANSAIDLLKPWPMKILVDNLLGPHPLPRLLRPIYGLTTNRETAALVLAAGMFLFVTIVGGAAYLAENYFSVKVGQKLVFDLRNRLFAHLHRLGLRFHDSRNVGDTIYRVTSDTWAVQTYLMHGLLPM